jgi:aryl-alcohol dehydrogenase-like predicted oxidoreductase
MHVEERILGRTGLRVSALGFGCGSVGGIFVRGTADEQRRSFEEAVAGGITYFDSAPGYGDGRSEENLGRVLSESHAPVSIGTKVRLSTTDVADVAMAVRQSLEASLRRLHRDRVDLFQLHNRIALEREESRDALGVADVLGPVADAMRAVQEAGLVRFLGFTGLGNTPAIHRVVASGVFDTVQVYFNALNPSAGWPGHNAPEQQDFAGLIDRAAHADRGVIVIRPLAAGALGGRDERHPVAGDPGPSLDGVSYHANRERARAVESLAGELGLEGPGELALRFALSKPGVSTVLIGFSDHAQLSNALRWSERGPLNQDAVERILQLNAPFH